MLVYNAAQRKFRSEDVLAVSVDTVERFWRVNCLGALLCAKQAIPDMLSSKPPAVPASAADSSPQLQPPHRGTILLTGASASMRSLAGYSSMSIGKFGLRALGQSLAREFGHRGIHVCHVVIDGAIDNELQQSYVRRQMEKHKAGQPSLLSGRTIDPATPFSHYFLEATALAEQYFQLHRQPYSCWTQELDLRPYTETIYARI